MKITEIHLENIKAFRHAVIKPISPTINVFIGPNNSGKSTILNSIFLLQKSDSVTNVDKTIGGADGIISLHYDSPLPPFLEIDSRQVRFELKVGQWVYMMSNNNKGTNVNFFQQYEPYNLIYPYLSKRKTVTFIDTMNERNANSVDGNFGNLYSKIDRISTTQYQPFNSLYVDACKNILGFEVATLAKGNGKQAVYFVQGTEHIALTAMGEGIVSALGLIVDLCVAKDKIFIIEEPENDIHPKALKALMNLIIEKSATNQFFVSTHSNIVMKYLGSAQGTNVFNVTNKERDETKPNLFLSKVELVKDNPEERRAILEDLGYDFFDFGLWRGWLFLEESSAEVLIRDYFIKWYVPELSGQLKTFSTNGFSSVIPKFEDFNKLFVFLHLEPAYKNKVWVIIDKGDNESDVIVEMNKVYGKHGWKESNFSQFENHDFERYLPDCFVAKVEETLRITDKTKKRSAKFDLLNEVKDWIKTDEEAAIREFKTSAQEVIKKLQFIKVELGL